MSASSGDNPGDPGNPGNPNNKPKISARELNARPLPKRFYKAISVGSVEPAGVAILLDQKPARTPKKRELRLPTLSLARAVAGEWAAQDDRIDPARMPMTRLANTAIDGVQGHEANVHADVVKYAASDLVCYRADRPEGLVKRQAELWDPVITWARTALGAQMRITTGLMHVPQPEVSVSAVGRDISALDYFALTGLHTMVTLTGSALLALGVLRGAWNADRAWTAAHVDEDWQISEWGEDAEAKARREFRWTEMAAAGRLLDLLEA